MTSQKQGPTKNNHQCGAPPPYPGRTMSEQLPSCSPSKLHLASHPSRQPPSILTPSKLTPSNWLQFEIAPAKTASFEADSLEMMTLRL